MEFKVKENMASQSISVKGVTKVDWEGEGGDATYEEMQNDVTVMPLSKYKKKHKNKYRMK